MTDAFEQYHHGMPPEVGPAPRLAHEGFRNLVALAIAAVVAIIALLGYSFVVPVRFTVDTVTLTVFVFWIGYSLAFLTLTHNIRPI